MDSQGHDNKNLIGSLVVGIAGGLAIIGVAAAITLIFKDKNTKDNIGKKLTEIKNKTTKYFAKDEKLPNKIRSKR